MSNKTRVKKEHERFIDTIVVHCADTPASMDIGAETIRKWHVEDNGWTDIGYHYVIRRNGTVENGRPLDQAGAHVSGHNATSVGICLVGGKGTPLFTEEQFEALEVLLINLKGLISTKLKIVGHCDLDNKKTCPNFDVAKFLKDRGLENE